MGEQTRIEWAHHTFNGWTGCDAISPACDHCYAKPLVEGRLGRSFDERVRNAPSTWAQPDRWNRKALADGVRRRVFCSSLSDVWDNQVPIEWLVDLLDVVRETTGLDWMLLTKRPMNILKRLKLAIDVAIATDRPALTGWLYAWAHKRQPPPNVWLGVTVENQAMADLRLPFLLDAPAAIYFVSAEPLLGPVNLRAIPRRYDGHWGTFDALAGKWAPIGDMDPGYVRERIRLVIGGGESGAKARPTLPAWPRGLRDDCAVTEAAFFWKQWGEWTPGENVTRTRGIVRTAFWFDDHWSFDTEDLAGDGGHIDDEPDLYRVGKEAAGRLLDSVEHSGMPDHA